MRDKNYKGRLTLGFVNKIFARKIKTAIDEDLTGREIILKVDEVRHIYNSHPETQIEQFYNLVKIFESPQIVLRNQITVKGYDRIKIIQQLNKTNIIICEVHIKPEYLFIVTMFLQ